MFDNSRRDPNAQTPPPHPRALTDDLLAVFDQHFLHDDPELLDGFDGLREEKKQKPERADVRRAFLKGAEHRADARRRTRSPLCASSGWTLPCSVRPVLKPAFLRSRRRESLSWQPQRESHTAMYVCVCDATFWLSWRALLQASQRCRGGFSGPSANPLAGSQRSAGNER